MVRTNFCPNPACAALWPVTSGNLAQLIASRETAPPVALPTGFVACTKWDHVAGAWQEATIVPMFPVKPGDVFQATIQFHAETIAAGDKMTVGFRTFLNGVPVRDLPAGIAFTVDAETLAFAEHTLEVTVAGSGENGVGLYGFVYGGTGEYYATGCCVSAPTITHPTVSYFDGDWAGFKWVDERNIHACYSVEIDPAAAISDRSVHVLDYAPVDADQPINSTLGVLLTLADGTLFAAYMEATDYKAPTDHTEDTCTGRVVYITSPDNGVTWSAPALVYDDEYGDWNVAGGLVGGRIVLTFERVNGTTYFDWRCIHSDDNGTTWSDATPMADFVWFSRIIEIPGVGFAMAWTNNDKLVGYAVTQDGVTWSNPTVVYESATHWSIQEPTMAYGNGLWVFAIRRTAALPGYTFIGSSDRGLTWGSPVGLAGSTVPPRWAMGGALVFASGRFWLFTANRQYNGEDGGYTADWFTWVYQSSAARLADDLEDWTLERMWLHPNYPISTVQYYGYPGATQCDDGTLVCLVNDYPTPNPNGISEVKVTPDLFSFQVSGLPAAKLAVVEGSLLPRDATPQVVDIGMVAGDTAPIVERMVTEGVAVNLTSCTVTWAIATAPGRVPLVSATAVVDSAGEGIFHVDLQAADTKDLGGFYYREASVVDHESLVKTLLVGRIMIRPQTIVEIPY